jgi:hypothetical protein
MYQAYNKSFEFAREKRGPDAQKARAPQFKRYNAKTIANRFSVAVTEHGNGPCHLRVA